MVEGKRSSHWTKEIGSIEHGKLRRVFAEVSLQRAEDDVPNMPAWNLW